MLVSVQVCSGVKVLRDWGVLSINSDSTLGDVFHGICTGQLDSPDGFRLEEEYADCPVVVVSRPLKRENFNRFPSASVYKTPWNSAST